MSLQPRYNPRFSDEEIELAQRICRQPNSSKRTMVKRARLLLALAENPGRSSRSYARELGMHEQTVRKWRKQWSIEKVTLDDKRMPGMSKSLFYGEGIPYTDVSDLTGQLIVIEGTDGVGRSTQIDRLTEWLEVQTYGVISTGWTRSALVGKAINRAKRGNTLNPLTLSLLYASDFADRLENQVIPALKSGFIVLADRYMYTAFARNVVRGADPHWIRRLFGFTLKPDLILYLDIDVATLVPRVMKSEKGLSYWESGMDLCLSQNVYDSFVTYQTRLLKEFDKMKEEFNFITIDASRGIEEVYTDLQTKIRNFLQLWEERSEANNRV